MPLLFSTHLKFSNLFEIMRGRERERERKERGEGGGERGSGTWVRTQRSG